MTPQGRVLVIDDDAQITEIVRQILAAEDYVVETLGEFTRALVDAAVARLNPDVVLLDSAGPREYGESWGLAARLRRLPAAPAVVMFTARGEVAREARQEETLRSKRADFAEVLEKPFNINELLDVVRRALAER